MAARDQSDREPISLGERIATAFVSAIAAALTLLVYFIISLVFASKSPSGPPKLLFDLFASKLSIGLVAAATLAGFILGASRMADVFAEFWGTSERSSGSWLQKVKAISIIVIAVVAIIHHVHWN